MPRRNVIPLVLLAILALLSVAFAILGATMAPSGATVAVQNASANTFGSPTGSTSFSMNVVNTVANNRGTLPRMSEVRLLVYRPPAHMAVYRVGGRSQQLGLLPPAAVTCELSVYASYVGGSTPWTPADIAGAYTRTESIADYSARVPRVSISSCAPVPALMQGQVHERAVVRGGYLVGLHLTAVVPTQALPAGGSVPHDIERLSFVLREINGTRTRTLSP